MLLGHRYDSARIDGKAHALLHDVVDNIDCFATLYKLYLKLNREQAGIAMRITTEYIKLDSFLKAVNEAASGGEAKLLVTAGGVAVNGAVEPRRGRNRGPGYSHIHGRNYLVKG
jgi:ribosome-associated protein